MKKTYFFLPFLLLAFVGKSQSLPPNQPEQNPCTPIVIACGQPFTAPLAYSGAKTLSASCWTFSGVPIVWVSVTAQVAGTLVFSITPGNPNTDYDFVVYDMTNITCNQLTTSAAAAATVRCEANDIYTTPGGVTGLSLSGGPTSQSAGAGNPWLAPINATAGTTYMIAIMMTANGYPAPYNAISGFTINFAGSTIFYPTGGAVSIIPKGPIRACQGEKIPLTATYTGSIPGVTYQWTQNGADIPGATTNTYTVSTAGAYSARAIGACGVPTDTVQIDYIVHPRPAIEMLGTSPICLGDYVTLSLIDSISGTTALLWQRNGVNISGASHSTYNAAVTGKYTITATIEGCPFVSDTLSLVVNDVVPAFTAKLRACKDELISFTNASTGNNLTYVWDMGDTTTETTTDVNHAYPYFGKYAVKLIATDDIGCKDSITKQIDIPVFELKIDPNELFVCPYKYVPLTSDLTPPSNLDTYEYTWKPTGGLSDTAVKEPIFHNDPGNYVYVFTVKSQPLGCVVNELMIVHVYPRTSLYNVTPDTKIAYGTSIRLNADGAMYYTWTPPRELDNPNLSNPIASPTEPTHYALYAINDNGCLDTAYTFIDIDYGMNEGMPNAFTPNGDGKNDVFRVINIIYQKVVEFKIYNRWGNEVFATNDAQKGWDGSYNGVQQPTDTYFYIVKVVVPDGTTKILRGDVSLIR